MCYQLRQIHQCPDENTPGGFQVTHTIDSFVRCSNPKPCRGLGFGRITKTYLGKDYCQQCLGSVVAARAPWPASEEFDVDFTGTEFVDNVLSYADALLEFAMLAIHESLPQSTLETHDMYPLRRLMKTLLWETMCVRCKVQLHCRCRPGRNESSWNVARHARSAFARHALQRFNQHTSPAARARETVGVGNEVRRAIDDAVAAMGGPVSYDVAPVRGGDPEDRYHAIARDMLDEYRPAEAAGAGGPQGTGTGPDRAARLATMEACTKFDLLDMMASVIAHDPGVPDDVVQAIASRLLPVLLVTREHLAATGDLPPLDTPYDAFAAPDGLARTTLPVAGVLRDGTFLPSLLGVVHQEALYVQWLYDLDPAQVAPDDVVGGRLRGGFERTVGDVHAELGRENDAVAAYEANRQTWWRTLLDEVHGGVEFLTTAEIPPRGAAPGSSSTSTSTSEPTQCFIHLSDFYEDVEMEEVPLSVNGGELEPQPLYRHRPIRLCNCVRSQDPHAFCMVSLAEWSFQRQRIGDKTHIVSMRPRRCNQCMKPLVVR